MNNHGESIHIIWAAVVVIAIISIFTLVRRCDDAEKACVTTCLQGQHTPIECQQACTSPRR
jgi:hypothetical protein